MLSFAFDGVKGFVLVVEGRVGIRQGIGEFVFFFGGEHVGSTAVGFGELLPLMHLTNQCPSLSRYKMPLLKHGLRRPLIPTRLRPLRDPSILPDLTLSRSIPLPRLPYILALVFHACGFAAECVDPFEFLVERRLPSLHIGVASQDNLCFYLVTVVF